MFWVTFPLKKCNKSNKIVRSFLEILNLTNGKDSVMITGA